jgi:hypothetical protein
MELKAIASRSLVGLPNASDLPRFHANLSWFHLSAGEPDELADGYRALVGASIGIADYFLAADLYRERNPPDGRSRNIFEIGGLRQVAPMLDVGVSFGFGIGSGSPPFRLALSFRQMF